MERHDVIAEIGATCVECHKLMYAVKILCNLIEACEDNTAPISDGIHFSFYSRQVVVL